MSKIKQQLGEITISTIFLTSVLLGSSLQWFAKQDTSEVNTKSASIAEVFKKYVLDKKIEKDVPLVQNSKPVRDKNNLKVLEGQVLGETVPNEESLVKKYRELLKPILEK